MEGILLRLADATQRQHDLISELRSIAAEFNATVNDIEAKTNDLQRRFNLRGSLETQSTSNVVQPQVAQSMGVNIVPMPAAETPFDIPGQFKMDPSAVTEDRTTLETLRRAAKRKRDIQMVRDHIVNGESYATLAERHGVTKQTIGDTIRTAVRLHYSMGSKWPNHRLPDDIAAKLEEMRE